MEEAVVEAVEVGVVVMMPSVFCVWRLMDGKIWSTGCMSVTISIDGYSKGQIRHEGKKVNFRKS